MSKEEMQRMINQIAQQFSSMSNPPPPPVEPDLQTPQTQPLQGQQENSAGGYSYVVDDLVLLKRYLVMGMLFLFYFSSMWTIDNLWNL